MPFLTMLGTALKVGSALKSSGLFDRSGPTRLKEIQSPEEQAYLSQLGQRSQQGTIPVDELQQVAGRTTAQFGQMNRQRMMGQMLSKGLGNSIVAMELMRKTDRETLSSLADESRKIALANEMSKIKAQDMLGEYGMMRSNRLMGIAQANAEYKRQHEANQSTSDPFASAGGLLEAGQKIFGGGV
tara:strand:- start:153 stop:707 length:555 start_codon:yes stop_codon:yes gene_type:complete